jgi:hypothetical protein
MRGCTVLHRCDSPHGARRDTFSGRRHSATTPHTAHPLEASDRCRLLALACRSPWPMPYTCGLCPMRYFERAGRDVARRGQATGRVSKLHTSGHGGGAISVRSAVGLDVAYFQRIELVDGDGSSRFEKLAVDFDEGRISWLALCIMIIRLANQKTTVGHCSWYHVIQPCVVPFLSCFFPHRVLHFRAQSYAQHHRRTMAPSLGSLVLQHDDIAGGPAGN